MNKKAIVLISAVFSLAFVAKENGQGENIRLANRTFIVQETASLPVELVDRALRTWEAPCTNFHYSFGGVDTGVHPAMQDGVNVIVWDESGAADSHALAITLSTVRGSTITDVDIIVNGNKPFAIGDDVDEDHFDLEIVLIHELGHALGLGHSDVPGATMAETRRKGRFEHKLHHDDEAGLCFLYPKGEVKHEVDSGCGCQSSDSANEDKPGPIAKTIFLLFALVTLWCVSRPRDNRRI